MGVNWGVQRANCNGFNSVPPLPPEYVYLELQNGTYLEIGSWQVSLVKVGSILD